MIDELDQYGSGRYHETDKTLIGWLIGVIGALGCAGIIGGIVMYGEVTSQTKEISALQQDVRDLRMELYQFMERNGAKPER